MWVPIGSGVCERLKGDGATRHIPVVFVTSRSGVADKVKAFRSGAIDYITKPFEVEELLARLGRHLERSRSGEELLARNRHLESLARRRAQELADGQLAAVSSLALLATARDGRAGRRGDRVGLVCATLAEGLGGTPVRGRAVDQRFVADLVQACSLYDIGNIGIEDGILRRPGRLTRQETDELRRHTIIGSQILLSVCETHANDRVLRMGVDIARSHHECWDGTGYPDGLVGEQIPLAARIEAVADGYETQRAMCRRKQALVHSIARVDIFDGRGSRFGPDVVDVFGAVEDEIAGTYAEAKGRPR